MADELEIQVVIYANGEPQCGIVTNHVELAEPMGYLLQVWEDKINAMREEVKDEMVREWGQQAVSEIGEWLSGYCDSGDNPG